MLEPTAVQALPAWPGGRGAGGGRRAARPLGLRRGGRGAAGAGAAAGDARLRGGDPARHGDAGGVRPAGCASPRAPPPTRCRWPSTRWRPSVGNKGAFVDRVRLRGASLPAAPAPSPGGQLGQAHRPGGRLPRGPGRGRAAAALPVRGGGRRPLPERRGSRRPTASTGSSWTSSSRPATWSACTPRPCPPRSG